MATVETRRIKTFYMANPSATEAGSLVTTGAGLVFGVGFTMTGAATANQYIALYDASAAGTACYDYGFTQTSVTRLLHLFQATAASAATTIVMVAPWQDFNEPIPFFDGLVVADCNFNGTVVGVSSMNVVVRIYSPTSI